MVGGLKVFFPDIDKDKLFLGTLGELYVKTGGKGGLIDFYKRPSRQECK